MYSVVYKSTLSTNEFEFGFENCLRTIVKVDKEQSRVPIYSLDNKGVNRSGGYTCILLSLCLLKEPSRVS